MVSRQKRAAMAAGVDENESIKTAGACYPSN
jgi:hypothetical protein